MRIDKLALATSALSLALTPAAPAQTPAPAAPPSPGVESSIPGAGFDAPESNTPIIRVSAQEVIVDVIVTDASGKPVHGLKASDFTVQENGKPQIIRSFYENMSGAATSKLKPVALPAGEYTNSNPLPAGGTINIFLLDPALPDISDWIINNLRTMPKGVPVGIFASSPSGLHTLQPITTDRDLLIRALSTPIYDRELNVPIGDWPKVMIRINGFNQLAAYLSGIPGWKNLFWFADSYLPPVMLMRDGGYSWGAQDMSVVHHAMDTYEMLTAAQVAVYPVFPPMLPHAPTPNIASNFDLRKAQEREISVGTAGAMRDIMVGNIAEDFGTVSIDRRNPNAVADAISQASVYYSLSYLPPKEKLDGHYHHISVTVNKPGLKLSYRKGYNSERTPTVDDPAPGPEMIKASMEGNALGATQILFDAAIHPLPPPAPATQPPATDAKLKKTKVAKTPPPKTLPYQIVYGFPASQIAFLEDEYQKLHGAVEFDVVAYDVRRARVASLTQTVTMPLSLDQFDQFASGPFQFIQQIDLPPGQLWIHVGILDSVSNRVGTLEFPIIVGDVKAITGFAPKTPSPTNCPSPPCIGFQGPNFNDLP
jgi:VWFA-related protein